MTCKIMYYLLLAFICIDFIYSDELVELGHDFGPDTFLYPTPNSQPFTLTPVYVGFKKEGHWVASFKFCTSDNSGTHIDAPFHASEKGWTVDQIPLENLIVPGVVIDVSKKVKTNSVYQVSARDVVEWVEANGLFPNNSLVLVNTGWSKRYSNPKSYLGHSTDHTQFAYPGLDLSAVQTLLGYRDVSNIFIVGIGIDTPSLDNSQSRTFPVHKEVGAANLYGLENLKDLDKVPKRGMEVTVMPMKIRGGGQAPCRVVARVHNGCSGKEATFGLVLVLLSIIYFN